MLGRILCFFGKHRYVWEGQILAQSEKGHKQYFLMSSCCTRSHCEFEDREWYEKKEEDEESDEGGDEEDEKDENQEPLVDDDNTEPGQSQPNP